MNIKLTQPYTKLYNQYQSEIDESIRKFASAKKPIITDPSTWEFSLNWCVQINMSGGSFFDVLNAIKSGKQKKEQQAKDVMSIDQKVQDYAIRCGVCLKVKAAPRRMVYTPLDFTPQEILDEYRNTLIQEEKEQQRVQSLTPIQRERELQEALKEFRKDCGFMEFSI